MENVEEPLALMLRRRLADRREDLAELRDHISENRLLFRKGRDCEHLCAVEGHLDDAQQALESVPPDLETARAALQRAGNEMDVVVRGITLRTKLWQASLAIWALLLLISAGLATYLTWQAAPESPEALLGIFPTRSLKVPWLPLRAVLVATSAGLAGGAIDLSRVLYLAIPARTFELRRVLWYFVAPFFGAALAAAVFLILWGGLLKLGGSPAPTTSSGAAGAFAIGFLIGFVPTAVHYRLNSVIKTLFGTDEVRAPQIAPPQAKREKQRVEVATTVTASAATRLLSVTLVVQAPLGTSSVAMRKVGGDRWSGSFELPEETDSKVVTLTIEARDEAGNLSRSANVSLALAVAASDSSSRKAEPVKVTTEPASGGSLPASNPITVRFSAAMRETAASLTGPGGEDVALQPQPWSADHKERSFTHAAALSPGSHVFAARGLAADGRHVGPVDVHFTVAP